MPIYNTKQASMLLLSSKFLTMRWSQIEPVYCILSLILVIGGHIWIFSAGSITLETINKWTFWFEIAIEHRFDNRESVNKGRLDGKKKILYKGIDP